MFSRRVCAVTSPKLKLPFPSEVSAANRYRAYRFWLVIRTVLLPFLVLVLSQSHSVVNVSSLCCGKKIQRPNLVCLSRIISKFSTLKRAYAESIVVLIFGSFMFCGVLVTNFNFALRILSEF